LPDVIRKKEEENKNHEVIDKKQARRRLSLDLIVRGM
jgi:hypothetical protein